jgi:O-acetyl-ADP-ribose deacetylase (regulator of RNase III)
MRDKRLVGTNRRPALFTLCDMITAEKFRSMVAAWLPPGAVREPVTADHPPLDCADGYLYVGPDQDCRWDVVLFERALYCFHDGNVRMRAPIRSFRPRLTLEHVEFEERFRDALRDAAGESPAGKLAALIDALVFRGDHFLWPAEPNLRAGDILSSGAEALVVTANPSFLPTGGIGAALAARAGTGLVESVAREARARFGGRPAPPGSLLATAGTGTSFRLVLHAVSLDVFYKTTPETIAALTCACLEQVEERGLKSVALPAFATGYGRLPIAACARAMMDGLGRFLAKGDPARLAVEIWLLDHHRVVQFEKGAGEWLRPRTVPFLSSGPARTTARR